MLFTFIYAILWEIVGESGTKWERRVYRRSVVKRIAEQMFLGQYQHRLDNKGRLTIPSRYRELLTAGAYVTQGFDRNLMVLTPETFQNISARVNQMSLTDPVARQLRRLIFATADLVEVDRSGRILIPQFLREVAQLEGEAIIVGAGNYFEIWSPDGWQAQVAEIQNTEANAQRFATLEISAGT